MRLSGKKKPGAYPTEATEQFYFFQWTELNKNKKGFEGLGLAFATNNGAWMKNYAAVGKLKRCGMKNGVPDIFIPVARRGFHGLFIEMKRMGTTSSAVSVAQGDYLTGLSAQGYCALIAKGCDEAVDITIDYFGMKEF